MKARWNKVMEKKMVSKVRRVFKITYSSSDGETEGMSGKGRENRDVLQLRTEKAQN